MTDHDPAAELGAAQRRMRRRILIAGAAIAAGALAIGVALFFVLREPPLGPPRIARPYLWQVTGNGAPAPSYLFGTMHIGFSVEDLPPGVLAAQDGAHTTVLETDLLAPPAPPPEHTGRTRLPGMTWEKLSRLTGVPVAELEAMGTGELFARALLAVNPWPADAMDRGFQERAVASGKKLGFLETRRLEEVMDEGTVIEGVEAIVANTRAFRAELDRIVRRYGTGDEQAGCTSGGVGDMKRELDAAWEAGVEAHVRVGGAFVAVGCAHLVGSGSLVERLRARGYQVERVSK